jgi:hypothetical protein
MFEARIAKRLILSFVFVPVVTVQAWAQVDFLQSAGPPPPPPFQFDIVQPPWSLTWQLATNDGRHVDLAINNIMPTGNQIFVKITPANATQYGVDFGAWALAVNDVDYTRSLISLNGVTQERAPFRTGGFIDLDHIAVIIDHPWPLAMGSIFPTAIASEAIVIPEATTLALFAIAAALHLCTRSCLPYRHR